MANIYSTSTPTISLAGVFRPVGRFFSAIGNTLTRMGEAYYYASDAGLRAEYLNRLSDEELAQRGINRWDIPRIAFRHYLY